MRVTSTAWRPGARVQLAVGAPASEADPVWAVTVDAGGRFTAMLRLQPAATSGRYVLLARRLTRYSDRATAPFRVTKGVTASKDWTAQGG